ncbi:MAG TPA: radical SAM protein [Candidatus Methanomethylophilaceae archaeon]|nr:radical SAM protein [Candidatus Methanomethylophilaceae archaeon]
MGLMTQFTSYAAWWIGCKFGRKRPLVNTMLINYDCNLSCRHCSIEGNRDALPPKRKLTYDEVERELREHFADGARILYFEGGEPTMWEDEEKNLGDLIRLGRKIGYFNIGYTTNGTNLFFTESDVISISLDGPPEVHDLIRGEGVYDMLMSNLDSVEHPAVFANVVIQKDNLHSVRETAEIARDHPVIKGAIFNFITPPPYEVAVSREEKEGVVKELLSLKKEGFPILNSKGALRLLLEEDFGYMCPYYFSAFVLPDGSHARGCPMAGTDSCKQCGFDAVREYYLIERGNPFTILEMSGMFALTKR